MKSYEALQLAIQGKTVEFAKRLGLSTVLLHKWQEPCTDYSDSGVYNPLDRIEIIVETALTKGHKDALAPIHYLNQRFDLISIPVEVKDRDPKRLVEDLSRLLKEFGDLVKEISKALEDGSISEVEANRIDKEAWELIREVATFNRMAKKVARP